MKPVRYQELLGRLLEGELRQEEADELARELNESSTLRQDLRCHLVLWDVWAQHQSTERSADAFVQSWATRLRTLDEDSDAFTSSVTAGIREVSRDASGRKLYERKSEVGDETLPSLGVIMTWFASVCTKVRRRAVLATASLAFIVLAFAYGLSTWSVHATIIRGEAVCTACVLHESHEHMPAMRVMTNNISQIYYLDRNQAVEGLQGRFCSGPTPATAKGTPRTEGKRELFHATKVEFPNAPSPGSSNKNDRILFPI